MNVGPELSLFTIREMILWTKLTYRAGLSQENHGKTEAEPEAIENL